VTRFLCIALILAACSDGDDAPRPREVSVNATVGDSGLSEDISFRVPENTRSITIVVEGAPDALYALGAFEPGDAADRVQLPAGAPGPVMESSYQQEQIGQMPGMLFQSIRLGTFSHIYPYAPEQAIVAGDATLRVASNRAGAVSVTILMPEDNGALTLPLNVYLVSDTLADPNVPAFKGELDRIFAQANVTVAMNGVERLTGTAFERITDFNEPQETPTSQSAMVTALADRVLPGSTCSSSKGYRPASPAFRSARPVRRCAVAATTA
jgi:hypothetical protein